MERKAPVGDCLHVRAGPSGAAGRSAAAAAGPRDWDLPRPRGALRPVLRCAECVRARVCGLNTQAICLEASDVGLPGSLLIRHPVLGRVSIGGLLFSCWCPPDELIRQVTVNCAERGLLLLRIRDEIRMTIATGPLRTPAAPVSWTSRPSLSIRRGVNAPPPTL